MPDHAEISALCQSVLEGCIMPENYASIWTGPQGTVRSYMNVLGGGFSLSLRSDQDPFRDTWMAVA